MAASTPPRWRSGPGTASTCCCGSTPSALWARTSSPSAGSAKRCARTNIASPAADPGALQQTVLSGCDRDRQQLGYPNLLGNRLTIGPQTCDVDLDRLDRPLPAFVDRAATGEASRQGRDGHEVAAAILRLHDDRVRPHRIILSQAPPALAILDL